jgi:IS30 family transposase
MKLRDLTRAEQTVMHFLSLGYSVRIIAQNMGVKNKTIEANIANVRRKVQYGGTIFKNAKPARWNHVMLLREFYDFTLRK